MTKSLAIQDQGDDTLRKIVAKNTKFSVVRESSEKRYPGSVIVIETNQDLVEGSRENLAELEQTVLRYRFDDES